MIVVTLLLTGPLALLCHAAEPQAVLDVWPGMAPGETKDLGKGEVTPARPNEQSPVIRIGNVSQPTLSVFLPAKEKRNGASVVVCPGGGFTILAWDKEGTEVAEWLNSIGVSAFVLKYRVPTGNRDTVWLAPVQDTQRSISLVRQRVAEWGLDPQRIGVLGFSAGGATAAHAATKHSQRQYKPMDEIDTSACRPDFAVMIHPGALADEQGKLRSDITVDKETPPCFFAHAVDDPVKCDNSIVLFQALRSVGVSAELHIYASGGHGFGLRPSEHPCAAWPQRCEEWLAARGALKTVALAETQEQQEVVQKNPPEPAAAGKVARLNLLTREEIDAGWIRLFDGETLFGWKANNATPWKIEDGVVWAETGEPGLLVTTTEFANYELRCDFRLATDGNSGIFLRSLFEPQNPAADCYELNMCDSHPNFPTGSLVGVTRPSKKVVGEGKWMTYHVTVDGHRIRVRLDGDEILDFTDKRPQARTRGFIGLQKNVGKAEYRNIFLRPLQMSPLFNGKDLTGWKVVPGSKSEFKVAEGSIQIQNGPGFLEATRTAQDFIFQAQIKTNGKHLNSGVFFRSLPPTEQAPSNGYEFQVHNGFKDNDRSKPVDFGTGAIYRRVPARRVVSNDFEWFTATLVAAGPHISTWIDGEQVTDWTDDRKPDENPRKGLRTEAGSFILQGHDPTTDLFFRKLQVSGYPR